MIAPRRSVWRSPRSLSPSRASGALPPSRATRVHSTRACSRNALAQHRSAPRRANKIGGRSRQPAVHLLYWRLQRRRVEDDRRRAHVDSRFSTISPPARSDRSWSRPPIQTCCTSAAAKARPAGSVGRRRRLQIDRRGQDLDASRAARRPADSQHRRRSRATRTGCSSPSPAILTDPTRSAEFSVRPTAASRSRRSSTRTRTPAETTSTSIRRIPNIVYATLWEERQGPWENAQWRGTGGGIFKSTDGGIDVETVDEGLPQNGALTQANVAIAPSNPKRLYAGGRGERRDVALPIGRRRRNVGADHAGQSSGRAHRRRRSAGADCQSEGRRHAHQSRAPSPTSRSTAARRGCRSKARRAATTIRTPGSTRTIPNIILLVSDQGAVVSLNGGETWSSWYNQPTAQIYHVNTDNALSVSRLRRPAGKRLGVRREPRQRRRRSRSANGIRSASRNTATPCPIRSIPTSSTAARSPATTGARRRHQNISPAGGGRTCSGTGAGVPHACARCRSCFRRSTRRCSSPTTILWKTMDGGVTGRGSAPTSRARPTSCPGAIGKYTDQPALRHSARRHLLNRAVVHRHQPDLGRDRRRPDPDDRRRRRDVEGRHAAGADAVDEGLRSSTPDGSTR